MARTLLILALFVAAASAFVNPASNAVASPAFTRTTAPKMAFDVTEIANSVSSVASNSNMIATQVSDFGGYTWPVFGIIALSGVILYFAPPLADE